MMNREFKKDFSECFGNPCKMKVNVKEFDLNEKR